MKKLFVLIFIAVLSNSLFSQENNEKNFSPSGKPFMKVYSNFHSTINGDETFNQFELTRAYLGYKVNLNEHFSGKMNIDVGKSDVEIGDSLKGTTSLKHTAYMKTAFFQYKNNKLLVKAGLIGLHQFKLSENLWGNRYLYKSFQDEYKFGSSADLGLYASYKIHDIISADITIINGEGYKKIEVDSTFKYGVGITLTPIEGLSIRPYFDYMGKDNVAQQTISVLAAYSNDAITVSAEYNSQSNNKMKDGKDFSGISAFASYKLGKIKPYLRFDHLASKKLSGDPAPWNIKKDGNYILAGLEFNPVKGIKLTPNYQGFLPKQAGSDAVHSIYLSCEIKF